MAVDLPADWIVASSQPGEIAILQSYPLDKYAGGQEFEPGDTKCDLVIHPAGTSAEDLTADLRAEPEIEITDEQPLSLRDGEAATAFRLRSLGAESALAITMLGERAVSLACYGSLTPFEHIAPTLRLDT